MRPQSGEQNEEAQQVIVDKHAVAALAGAVALFAGGASALADAGGTGTQRCDQLLAKIAEKRGVSPDELRANLEARLLARIDGAENAGKISAGRRPGCGSVWPMEASAVRASACVHMSPSEA